VKNKELEGWLFKTNKPYAVIAQEIGVTAKTVYNWIDKLKQKEKLPHKAYLLLNNYLDKNYQMEYQISTTVQKQMDNQENLIDLQNEKIEEQKTQLEHLKELLNDNPLQNKLWSEIQADFSTNVEVTIKSFSPDKRRITNMKGMSSIKKLLKLTNKDEKRIWRENEWFKFEKHPCNEIIEEESLKMLQKETKTMPSLLESLRLFIGNFYMGIPVIYSYNNKIVVTHCYLKIGWKLKPITIFTKNVIIDKKIKIN